MLEFLVFFNIFFFALFLIKWKKDNQRQASFLGFQGALIKKLDEMMQNQQQRLLIHNFNKSLDSLRKLSNSTDFSKNPREYLEEYSKTAFEKSKKGEYHMEYFFDIFVMAYFTYLSQVDPVQADKLLDSKNSLYIL